MGPRILILVIGMSHLMASPTKRDYLGWMTLLNSLPIKKMMAVDMMIRPTCQTIIPPYMRGLDSKSNPRGRIDIFGIRNKWFALVLDRFNGLLEMG